MFHILSALLMAGLVIALTPADDEKKTPSTAPNLNGKVLDIFEKDLVLVSVGKEQGAKKGQILQIYCLEPAPEYHGSVELVDTGRKHSLGRLIRLPFPYEHLWGPVHEGDVAAPSLPPDSAWKMIFGEPLPVVRYKLGVDRSQWEQWEPTRPVFGGAIIPFPKKPK